MVGVEVCGTSVVHGRGRGVWEGWSVVGGVEVCGSGESVWEG